VTFSHYEPRSEEEIASWRSRDPLAIYRERLVESGTFTAEDLDQIEADADAEMEAAEQFAMDSPSPEASVFEGLLYAQ